ncbi:glycosyltransferase [bacterium]|nr:glycosyltransferase [bacterium]
MSILPRVAVIYVSYHCDEHLPDAVRALLHCAYPAERLALVVVDNPAPGYGSSAGFIERTLAAEAGASPLETALLAQQENRGYGAGVNAGIAWAAGHGCEYVFLHNDDGYVEAGCIGRLVDAMERTASLGAAQPLILLHPETHLVNTARQAFQYLGFGHCGQYRTRRADLIMDTVEETGSASGCAVLLRTRVCREVGMLDEGFFLYQEDLEYSLRLRIAGYRTAVVRDAVFFHKYHFARTAGKYYFLERNRWAVLLLYYRWRTLLLLLPMGVTMECGLLVLATAQGWLREKLRAMFYWCRPGALAHWLRKRKRVQALRTVSDRELLRLATPRVVFADARVENPLLRHVANPLLALYWKLAYPLIRW